MDKSPIEIAIGQTNILIEDEVCKAVGKAGIHINKEELLKALKAYEFVEELTNYIFAYPDDDYMTIECLCRKLHKYGLIEKKDGEWTADFIDRKTKPTISKMEQVEDEPQNGYQTFSGTSVYVSRFEEEPQTDNGIGCSRCVGRFDCCDRDMPNAVHCNNYGKITGKPQTERSE